MWVMSRPEVGAEVRAWFSKVLWVCRSYWEALLPLWEEREGCVDTIRTHLGTEHGSFCLQISLLFPVTDDRHRTILARSDSMQVL